MPSLIGKMLYTFYKMKKGSELVESDKSKDDVQRVNTNMIDCCILMNFKVSRYELKALNQRIDAMKNEFSDLQVANKNSRDKEDLANVKELIAKIDKVL